MNSKDERTMRGVCFTSPCSCRALALAFGLVVALQLDRVWCAQHPCATVATARASHGRRAGPSESECTQRTSQRHNKLDEQTARCLLCHRCPRSVSALTGPSCRLSSTEVSSLSPSIHTRPRGTVSWETTRGNNTRATDVRHGDARAQSSASAVVALWFALLH